MFNQDPEPNYVTFDSVGAVLDSFMAEKLESLTADIKAEVQRMINNGEITL